MNLKALQRNIIPATAIAAGGSLTSIVHRATEERGLRVYVTATGATGAGAGDTVFLCAVPPGLVQGITTNPLPSQAIPLAGVASTASFGAAPGGITVVDFYPGLWLPSGFAANGALIGGLGIEVPIFWAVKIQMGAGNAATITVDGELYP